MRRAGRLVGALLLGWVACWLSLGLWKGNPTLLLHPQNDRGLVLLYLLLLYAWLLAATGFCWRRWGPRAPGFGKPYLFGAGLLLGVGATGLHRAALAATGAWTPPAEIVWSALLTAPLLAGVEEAVFRGYLFGTVREDAGRGAAYLGVNGFFALVHLFRPGSLAFKLALGLGLLLAGVALSGLAERTGSLWPGIGLHTVWVATGITDPPADFRPSLWAGLNGEPAAGLLGWLMLGGIYWMVRPKGGRDARV